MASYPVTVYSSDDSGAPQLDDGKISSFFSILQKCLVEGYGTKDPLGWTRSYHDPATFKAAWRNNVAAGGSGGSAYFYSNTNTDVSQTNIRVSAVKSITEAGLITGQSFIHAIQIKTSVNKWVLIGTAIGFHFYSFGTTLTWGLVNHSSTARPAFYMGDIFSAVPNDAGRFISFLNISAGGDTTFTNSLTALSTNTVVSIAPLRLQNADGSSGSQNYTYCASMSGAIGSLGTNNSNEEPLIYPKLIVPVVIFTNISNLNASTTVDNYGIQRLKSISQPSFRGLVPGIFGTNLSFGYNKPLPLIVTELGKNYHTLPVDSGNNSSCIIVQASGSWDDPFI